MFELNLHRPPSARHRSAVQTQYSERFEFRKRLYDNVSDLQLPLFEIFSIFFCQVAQHRIAGQEHTTLQTLFVHRMCRHNQKHWKKLCLLPPLCLKHGIMDIVAHTGLTGRPDAHNCVSSVSALRTNMNTYRHVLCACMFVCIYCSYAISLKRVPLCSRARNANAQTHARARTSSVFFRAALRAHFASVCCVSVCVCVC